MIYPELFFNICDELEKYVTDNKIDTLVLGISGGIDSAVCAAICEHVANSSKKRFVARSLPICSKREEMERAIAVGFNFCNKNNNDKFDFCESKWCQEVDSNIYFGTNVEIEASNQEEKERRSIISAANIKARLRMIRLYYIANLTNGIVISTDNLTEYFLGFWTLHGDVGDYGPIQNLWKTEVYSLAMQIEKKFEGVEYDTNKVRAMRSCIDAVPTDGLGISNSDFDQLGCSSYEEIDKILQGIYNPETNDLDYGRITDFNMFNNPIIQRSIATSYKRKLPISVSRKKLFLND